MLDKEKIKELETKYDKYNKEVERLIKQARNEGYKAGERKVVEWLENHSHILDSYHTEEWQAFLKSSEGIE